MSQTVDLDEFITTEEFAALVKKKRNTCEIWRHQGKGPPFYKLGDAPNSPVRYLRSEVIAWIKEQAFNSTSAHTAAVREKQRAPLKVTPAAIPGPWQNA